MHLYLLRQDDISTSIRLLEAERILGLYIYLPRLVDIINNEEFVKAKLENLLFLMPVGSLMTPSLHDRILRGVILDICTGTIILLAVP